MKKKLFSSVRYYTLKAILEKAPDAQYYVIFGERSNGKTFSVLEYGLEDYIKNGNQIAIVRRWKEDFKGKNGPQLFDAFVNNEEKGNLIAKMTSNKWNDVYFYSGRWYLQRNDKDGKFESRDETPFAYAFALTSEEHDKSISFPRIRTILFDEFMSRLGYLPDEFMTFMNTISTIVRQKDNVKIFMCGNTVNKYCPYFNEMGLRNIKTMKKGTIDVYTYGESKLKVAVEYSDFPAKSKKSDVYFAFNNPKLRMITTGEWEINIYPHCPAKYRPKDILFTYFISFDRELFQCEIIGTDKVTFTFIHRKTTPIKDPDDALIYQEDYDPRPNYSRKLNYPINEMQKKVASYFTAEKVFYQDNEVGESIRNYLQWCGAKLTN